MEVIYHPLVKIDVEEALSYYQSISERLGGEFHSELQDAIARLTSSPLKSHIVDNGFRRVNLKRFPYHLVYEVLPNRDQVRVMIIRHNKRNPKFGAGRQSDQGAGGST